ncbi:MAG: TetR/AcrR family transcriptional regulator [Pseudomonadota bacterium]
MQQQKLTAEIWLDLALDTLAQEGFNGLKALPLAKKLKVTRGSFYYHFESLEAFHNAVVAHWAKRTSGPVIEGLQNSPTAKDALHDLLQTTLQSGEVLERAVRSWATVEHSVAEEVAKVDLLRIGVAEDLLQRSGVPATHAAARARLLYWAAIGRLMMPFPDASRLSAEDITEITGLMLSRA